MGETEKHPPTRLVRWCGIGYNCVKDALHDRNRTGACRLVKVDTAIMVWSVGKRKRYSYEEN